MFFLAINRNISAPPLSIAPQTIINRLMPFAPPDKSGFLADGDNGLLVQCLHWNTARSRLEPAPLHHAETGIQAASWARLDNREELGKKLDLDPAELAAMGDTELILFSYLKWSEACVDHLIGDFVFVIHDRKHNKVFCGRDHMGVRPFYYFVSDNLFVCATSLAALRQLEQVPLVIDPQWLAEYLMSMSMSFNRTPYQGIMKLPPAHCLTVTPKSVQLRQYFTLSAEPELKLADSRDYVAAYRGVLEEAIRCRLDSDYHIGCELSGGIDSSTIAVFAARFMEHPATQLHTFGFTIFELDHQYITAVSRKCRHAQNHIFADAETAPEAVRQRSLELLGYPVEHGNAISHEQFYRSAEQLEIRTLLSGFGGDEFCTTTHGYMVPMEMAVQGRYRELFNYLPGNPLYRFLRLLKLEWRRRNTANFTTTLQRPDFFEAYNQRWPHRIVRDELVTRFKLDERYFEEARFNTGYTDMKKFILEKRWDPFVPTRMENCSLMAAGRKIDYRWPLLDIRLVRLFLSIPSRENFYRGMGRYLHRRAIDDVLPKQVVWNPKKNMGSFMGLTQSETKQALHLDSAELHPALTECIDMEKLRRQVEQLPSVTADMTDNNTVMFRFNIMTVKRLNEWLQYEDTR